MENQDYINIRNQARSERCWMEQCSKPAHAAFSLAFAEYLDYRSRAAAILGMHPEIAEFVKEFGEKFPDLGIIAPEIPCTPSK
jgi:hypothetical protein